MQHPENHGVHHSLYEKMYCVYFKDIISLYHVIYSCFLMQRSSFAPGCGYVTLSVGSTTPQKSWSVPFLVRNYCCCYVSCTGAPLDAVVTLGGLRSTRPRQVPPSVAKFRKIGFSFLLHALIIGEFGWAIGHICRVTDLERIKQDQLP